MNRRPEFPYFFALNRPVVVNGREVPKLRVAEPPLSAMLSVLRETRPEGRLRKLVAVACGVPAEVVDKMAPADVAAIGKICRCFFDDVERLSKLLPAARRSTR
jgi:hypothetical protein